MDPVAVMALYSRQIQCNIILPLRLTTRNSSRHMKLTDQMYGDLVFSARATCLVLVCT
jgi:hypothetical protein